MDLTYEVDGVKPDEVWYPETQADLASAVAEATRAGRALIPWGGGTAMGLGTPPIRYDIALDMTRLQDISAFSPDDLTITVESGMPLAHLNAVLATEGLRLALDVPHAERATVGGVVAANTSGPLRHRYGTPRDLALGVRLITGEGPVRGGGRVLKNVAGYDLVRLFVGSLGTLGVISEVTFKLLPMPRSSGWWQIDRALLDTVLGLDFDPAAVEVTATDAGVAAFVCLEGEETLIRDQLRRLPAAIPADAPPLRDRPWEEEFEVVVRLSVLPSEVMPLVDSLVASATRTVVQASPGPGIVRVGTVASAVADLRRRFDTVVVEKASPAVKPALDVWGAADDSLELMRQVKALMDPTRCFAPGRFWGGL